MRFTATELGVFYRKYGVCFKHKGRNRLIDVTGRRVNDNIFHDEREPTVVFIKFITWLLVFDHFLLLNHPKYHQLPLYSKIMWCLPVLELIRTVEFHFEKKLWIQNSLSKNHFINLIWRQWNNLRRVWLTFGKIFFVGFIEYKIIWEVTNIIYVHQ